MEQEKQISLGKWSFTLRKKEAWHRFVLKALLVLIFIGVAYSYFGSRYFIAFDEQVDKCIPGTTLYLIDTKDKNIQRDKTYAFYAKNMEPIYKDGTRMLKFVRGMPGDTVEITEGDYRTLINGKELFRFLPLVPKLLGRTDADFVVKGTLGPGKYWMFGTSPTGFDSRYWGAMDESQVIGRAYPIF